MTQVYEDPLLLRMLSWFFFKAIVVFSTRDNYIISSCTVFMELTHFLSFEPTFDNEGVLSKRLSGFMGLGKIRSCGVRKNG